MRLLRRTLIHFARLLFPERRKNRLLCSHVIQEIVRCDSDIGLGSTSLCASVDSPERKNSLRDVSVKSDLYCNFWEKFTRKRRIYVAEGILRGASPRDILV